MTIAAYGAAGTVMPDVRSDRRDVPPTPEPWAGSVPGASTSRAPTSSVRSPSCRCSCTGSAATCSTSLIFYAPCWCVTSRSGGRHVADRHRADVLGLARHRVLLAVRPAARSAVRSRPKFLAWVLAVTIIPAVHPHGCSARIESSFDFTSVEFGLSSLFLGGIWVYAATYPGVKWFEVIPLWALAAVFTVLNLLQYSGNDADGQGRVPARRSRRVAGRRAIARASPPDGRSPTCRSTAQVRTRKPARSKPKKQKKPRSSRSSGGSSAGSSSSKHRGRGPVAHGPPPMPPHGRPTLGCRPGGARRAARQDRRHGMDSLTGDEKKRLNELSKRLRNR